MRTSPVLALLTAVATQTAMAAGAPPTTVELTGVVRDFKRAHPDFDVMPIGGPGHYAGNVDLAISSADRPVFAGGGFKVDTQWKMASLDPLAPHLYVEGGGIGTGIVELVNDPVIENNPTIDTFDSSEPYGGDNVGPAPDFVTGATMPDVTVPTGLPWTKEVIYSGNGTSTLSSSVHCKKFELLNHRTLQISGNVTIVADDLFKLNNHVEIVLLAGATLDIYALKDLEFTNNVDLNVNTGNPNLVTVYYMGDGDFKIANHADVYAQIIAPDGKLIIENNGDLFGGYTGKDFNIKNSGGFHVDGGGGGPDTFVCGTALNDSAGNAGVSSDAAVTSSTTFAQWYREILGVNLATSHSITLTLNGSGVYEYLNAAFYPIDGQLFGNEGDANNNYFTYRVDGDFTYTGCGDQFIEFMGADDAWIYIDGGMVIDLGGIVALTDQRIDLDRLGLVDGEEYTMELFFAHRADGGSQFNLRTNIEMWSDDVEVTVSLPCD